MESIKVTCSFMMNLSVSMCVIGSLTCKWNDKLYMSYWQSYFYSVHKKDLKSLSVYRKGGKYQTPGWNTIIITLESSLEHIPSHKFCYKSLARATKLHTLTIHMLHVCVIILVCQVLTWIHVWYSLHNYICHILYRKKYCVPIYQELSGIPIGSF